MCLISGTLSKVVSACCGLAAFAIAVLAGLAVENPGDVILLRALLCMVACQGVGLVVGMIIERVVAESIETYKQSKPAGSPGPEVELSTKSPSNTGAAVT